MTPLRWFLAVAGIVFLSRIPFLDAGYGYDLDAWRLVAAARATAETGRYFASRLPGHPVQEIVASALWNRGPVVLNGLTALFSALAAASLGLVFRRAGSRDGLAAALALASTPVIFVNSTTTMDYVWALGFVVLALLGAVSGRPKLAGLALGLAIGCRITSGALVLPIAILVARGAPPRERFPRVAAFAGIALAAGAFTYLPVLASYGPRFLDFHDITGARAKVIARRGLLEVFGPIGCAGVGIAALGALARAFARTKPSIPSRNPLPEIAVWALGAALLVAGFLRLPDEAGYLVPAIPFVLLLLGQAAPRPLFLLACACLVASPWIGVGPRGVSRGTLPAVHAVRLAETRFARRILAQADSLPPRSVVVAGHWLLLLDPLSAPGNAGTRGFTGYLRKRDVEALRAEGRPVYFLPGVSERSITREKFEMKNLGARPLFKDPEALGMPTPPVPTRYSN